MISMLKGEETHSQAQRGAVGDATNVQVPRWKRVLDCTCILLAIPIWLPLMALIAVAIKLGSTGPVLFRQERIGHLGQRFVLLKFRTMVAGADTRGHQQHCKQLITSNVPMEKLDAFDDPRIIPGGWKLRGSGLDELPQLINVLRGDMSLVGPRPCLPYEYEEYEPWQRERFNTLPGLTGLWQVSGKNKTTFEEMMRLDIHYARYKSWRYDVRIILRTVPAMVSQFQETRSKKKLHELAAQPKLDTSVRPIRSNAVGKQEGMGYG
jgi:lipopolysaccharide/colanic/teichoic acid biosynthesis glycosyltransferase